MTVLLLEQLTASAAPPPATTVDSAAVTGEAAPANGTTKPTLLLQLVMLLRTPTLGVLLEVLLIQVKAQLPPLLRGVLPELVPSLVL